MALLNNSFEFRTAQRIIFGPGRLKEAGPIAATMGRRGLLIAGLDETIYQPFVGLLEENGIQVELIRIRSEPTIETIAAAAKFARETARDLVIGMGGGSAMDTAKAVAALSANPGEIQDYLEVVGKGKPLKAPSLPCIAIPTTAGTGAEVTRNAVLGVPGQRVKVSLRSPHLLPSLAIVDPELTYQLPPTVTASTGLDALTQLIEPYVSNAASPITDGLSREGMHLAAGALISAYENGDPGSRQAMSAASLLGGLCLANARLGAVHGFADVLGGALQAQHGAICAALLPPVMAANIKALRERYPEADAIRRYTQVAQILTGDLAAEAEDGAAWVASLCKKLKVAPLAALGLTREAFPEIIDKSINASSMKGNPIMLGIEELEGILERAL